MWLNDALGQSGGDFVMGDGHQVTGRSWAQRRMTGREEFRLLSISADKLAGPCLGGQVTHDRLPGVLVPFNHHLISRLGYAGGHKGPHPSQPNSRPYARPSHSSVDAYWALLACALRCRAPYCCCKRQHRTRVGFVSWRLFRRGGELVRPPPVRPFRLSRRSFQVGRSG